MGVRYGPNEGIGEERERFWNEMGRTVDRVGNRYRLCLLGDLNGWFGDRVRAGITDAFEVPGENKNGRRVVEFCDERGLCVGNIYFEHKNLHKGGKGPRWSGGKEHERSSAGEERYAAFCTEYESSEGNGVGHFGSLCCTV